MGLHSRKEDIDKRKRLESAVSDSYRGYPDPVNRRLNEEQMDGIEYVSLERGLEELV